MSELDTYYKGCAFPKTYTMKKEPKPIPKISEKKKTRIKEEGSEWDLFIGIAKERSKNGRVTAKDLDGKTKSIRLEDLRVINFAHIVAKWKDPKKRLDPKNIEIVTFALHFLEHTGQRYSGKVLPN